MEKKNKTMTKISVTSFEFNIFRLPKVFEQFTNLSSRSSAVQGMCRVFARSLSQKDWINIFRRTKKKRSRKRKKPDEFDVSDNVVMSRILTAIRKVDTFDLCLVATRESASEVKYSAIQAFLIDDDDSDSE